MIKSLIKQNVLRIIISHNSVNSINIAMLEEIHKVIDESHLNPLRCIVFSSNMKHFCAGADLKERSKLSNEKTLEFLDLLNDLYFKIQNLKIPTISLINGACLGGGLELALSCDFRIGIIGSSYSFPEASIGIIPGAGGTQRLTRLIGPSKAMKWIFSSIKYTAEDALLDGVIDFKIDHKDSEKYLEEFILNILKNAPISIKSAKKSINSAFIDFGFKVERQQYIKTLISEDRNEGLSSFIYKKTPKWKNK